MSCLVCNYLRNISETVWKIINDWRNHPEKGDFKEVGYWPEAPNIYYERGINFY